MTDNLQRVLIMGNSGSGKSWMAMHLSERTLHVFSKIDPLKRIRLSSREEMARFLDEI